jgi:hypothetical protein
MLMIPWVRNRLVSDAGDLALCLLEINRKTETANGDVFDLMHPALSAVMQGVRYKEADSIRLAKQHEREVETLIRQLGWTQ